VHDQDDKCDKDNIIRQLLKVQAQITVTPLVTHGNPNVYCLDSCIKPNTNHYDNKYDCDTTWESGCRPKCNFTLTQVVCVEIPISIDVDVDIKKGIVCCGRPEIKDKDEKRKCKQFYMPMI